MRSPHWPRAVGEAIASRRARAESDRVWVISAWLRSDWSTWPNFWALDSASPLTSSGQLRQLGTHLGLHLVEPGVDDRLSWR